MSNNFQRLSDWLDYISQSHPSEIELGLERVKSVYRKMDFKSRPKKVVVVAGTNGKGSTIALTLAGLSALGLKCGAYTSPHIVNYNERVHLLGADASDQTLVDAFQYVNQQRGEVPLTYFEFGTLAALYILFNTQLDVVLLEIGLGGRLDAVNIVDADISVITSIDIDHVDWLGSDIQQIGLEKAGILRSGQTFLAGEQLPASVFQHAKSLSCQTLACHHDFFLKEGAAYVSAGSHESFCVTSFPELALPDNNLLLALQLMYLLKPGKQFDAPSVCRALSGFSLPGRLEASPVFNNVYFDVGHNPHAARFLASFLAGEKSKGKDIEVVYSALGDKDVSGVVAELATFVDSWLLAPLSADRALSVDELASTVRALSDQVRCFDSIAKALEFSLANQSAQEESNPIGKAKLVLVFGSFFTVEAAKKYMERYE